MYIPLKIAMNPSLLERETLTSSLIGSLQWHDLFTETISNNTLPAILSLRVSNNRVILMPCSVSPASRFWQFNISMEPTSYQPWTNSNADPSEIISALENVTNLPWVSSLQWTFPFWLSEQVSEYSNKVNISSNIQLLNRGTWILKLDSAYDLLVQKNFKKSTRRQLKLAIEKGTVVIESPTVEQVDAFAKLWRSVYDLRGWKGIKFSGAFFHACQKYFKNEARLVLASVNNEIVAGGLFLSESEGSVYYLSAMDMRYKDFYPMDAIIGFEISNLCKANKKYINLGGIGEDPDLIVFKERWGATEVPLFRYNFSQKHKSLSLVFSGVNRILGMIIDLYFQYNRRERMANRVHDVK